ncbi:unnamed protein product [Cladocopium goreaui]|nr:unnamed protein product [Cladocopium goreaui]
MDVRRVFYCMFPIPKLAEKLLGRRATVICVEEAHWDLNRRRLTVHGRNETGQSVLRIDEVCCYTEVAPGKTLYTQSATVKYKKGLLSGLLTPVAAEILSGVCQRNARSGLSAMIAGSERERATLAGEVIPIPVDSGSSHLPLLLSGVVAASALLLWRCVP